MNDVADYYAEQRAILDRDYQEQLTELEKARNTEFTGYYNSNAAANTLFSGRPGLQSKLYNENYYDPTLETLTNSYNDSVSSINRAQAEAEAAYSNSYSNGSGTSSSGTTGTYDANGNFIPGAYSSSTDTAAANGVSRQEAVDIFGQFDTITQGEDGGYTFKDKNGNAIPAATWAAQNNYSIDDTLATLAAVEGGTAAEAYQALQAGVNTDQYNHILGGATASTTAWQMAGETQPTVPYTNEKFFWTDENGYVPESEYLATAAKYEPTESTTSTSTEEETNANIDKWFGTGNQLTGGF